MRDAFSRLPDEAKIMKTVTMREVKAKLSRYMKLARTDVVIITKRGRAAAVLQAIDPEDLEEVAYETGEAFRSLITARRKTPRRKLVRLRSGGRAAGRGRG